MSATNVLLDLTIEALAANRYRLTVNNSPGGKASDEIAAPFTLADLAELGDILEGRAGANAADRDKAARDAGEKLFNAIFGGALKTVYATTRTHGAFTIRVDLSRAGLLADFTWSLLSDPVNGLLSVETIGVPFTPRAIGGLREAIRDPRLVLLLFALIIASIAGIALTRIAAAPPSDVDLVVSGLHLLPQTPGPGEVVTIAIQIQNLGTSPSGPFKWAWFQTNSRNRTPDVVNDAKSIDPGVTLTVRGEFLFGLWDTYDTVAWVNFDGKVAESNTLNNFSNPDAGHITLAAEKPLIIDFTRLPNNTLLSVSQDLRGDEFTQWGLTFKADGSTNPLCPQGIVKLAVQPSGVNQLITGLPGRKDTCADLPISVAFSKPIGTACIDFMADKAGDYTLSLLDANGKAINAKVTAAQPGMQTITLPENGSALPASANITQLVLRGAGSSLIQRLTLSKAAG